MGRTNVVVDDQLIRKAMKLFGVRTKREAIDKALRQTVERAEVYEGLRKLWGKVRWEGNLSGVRRPRAPATP